MKNKVVTRFAPSPTGLLHGGNYRTAVFAYLFAKKEGGEFIVRIEDTDKERSKKEYEDNIIETLEWLGLKEDRRFRQSEHVARHTQELERLITSGAAYVSKEEAAAEGQRSEVIRFKNPNVAVTFSDAIRGEITMDTTDLGDFVIARSMQEPVFHLAVVVDDADEGVTHVVRGEDHISNTPRQILIQRALGYPTPLYAHLPLVLGSDRTKLSKRRGARALTEYRNEGYLPSALINYLAFLGWHPEGEKEIYSVAELIEAFTLERIQKSAGIFDEVKLSWFNHEHMKLLSNTDFFAGLEAHMKGKGVIPSYLTKVLPLLRERAATFGQAVSFMESGEFSFLDESVTHTRELLLQNGKLEASLTSTHLQAVRNLLIALSDEAFTPEKIKDAVFPYATEAGRGAVLWPLRTALSGKEKSPDPFSIASILGKEKTLRRIEEAAKIL